MQQNVCVCVLLKIRSLIGEQTIEWTDMIARQMEEQYVLSREHLQLQMQMFPTLMQTMQEQQLKDLDLKHERYTPFRSNCPRHYYLCDYFS